jgi:hypothetical protein
MQLPWKEIVRIIIHNIVPRAQRNYKVWKLLKLLHLDPRVPPRDFDGLYAYALATFAADKPAHVVEFFAQDDVRQLFRQAYGKPNAKEIFDRNIREFVAGELDAFLSKHDFDPRSQINDFYKIFDHLASRGLEAKEIRNHEDMQVIKDNVRQILDLQARSAKSIPSVFVSPEVYFGPLMDSKRIFHHRWQLIGREAYVQQLMDFIRSPDKRVIVLTGRGGIGKTKILHAFSELAIAQGYHGLRFVREGWEPSEEDYRDLPQPPIAIVVDDAHRHGHLLSLLTRIQSLAYDAKVILSIRPYGKNYISSCLTRACFDDSQIVFLEELSELSLEDVERLAEQALGPELSFNASTLARLTADSPLVTVVAGRLLRERQIPVSLLQQDEQFQRVVFSRFEDVLLGILDSHEDPVTVRRILRVIAAVSPYFPDRDNYVEATARFLGIKSVDLQRIVGMLEEYGILIRQGTGLRITPDVLADHILWEACFAQNGYPTGYATELYLAFRDVCFDSIMTNLSELDWRVNKVRGECTELLNAIWEHIYEEFPKQSNHEKDRILQTLERIAVYQPARTLQLVELALALIQASEPIPQDHLERLIHFSRRLAVLLYNIAYYSEFTRKCCDMLWKLGCDDDLPLNQHPDHPMRVLAELAKYAPDKSLHINMAVLAAVESWMRRPDAFTHVHSPLLVLKPLLAKTVEHTYFDNWKLIGSARVVKYEHVKTIRMRILKLIKGLTESVNTKVVIEAIDLLGHAFADPVPLYGLSITDADLEQWLPEQFDILHFLGSVINRSAHPLVHLRIAEILWWYSHYGPNYKVRNRVQEILSGIPSDFEHRITEALCFPQLKEWVPSGETHEVDDWKRLRDRDDLVRKEIARQFIENYPNPADGVRNMESRIAEIKSYNVASYPSALLIYISATNSHYAAGMCETILDERITLLIPHFPALLINIRDQDYESSLRILQRAVESEDSEVQLAIASYLQVLCYSGLREHEKHILDLLLQSNEPMVKMEALKCLQVLATTNDLDYVVTRVMELNLEDNVTLADAMCETVLSCHAASQTHQNGFTEEQLRALLIKLERVPSLSSDPPKRFLGMVASRDPLGLFDFLVRRIRLARSQESPFEAVPRGMVLSQCRFQIDGQQYRELLRQIRNMMIPMEHITTTEVVSLFYALSGGINDVVIEVFNEWVDTGDDIKIRAIAILLCAAEDSFVFERPDFIENLLERSYSVSEVCHQLVNDVLDTISIKGDWSRKPGEPSPYLVGVRDRALEIATEYLPGSPTREFYCRLASRAESIIQHQISLDESMAKIM